MKKIHLIDHSIGLDYVTGCGHWLSHDKNLFTTKEEEVTCLNCRSAVNKVINKSYGGGKMNNSEKCEGRSNSDYCTGMVDEYHPCPFEQEIFDNDDDICKCCTSCAQECKNDI